MFLSHSFFLALLTSILHLLTVDYKSNTTAYDRSAQGSDGTQPEIAIHKSSLEQLDVHQLL